MLAGELSGLAGAADGKDGLSSLLERAGGAEGELGGGGFGCLLRASIFFLVSCFWRHAGVSQK